jgi:hypothetical protein
VEGIKCGDKFFTVEIYVKENYEFKTTMAIVKMNEKKVQL